MCYYDFIEIEKIRMRRIFAKRTRPFVKRILRICTLAGIYFKAVSGGNSYREEERDREQSQSGVHERAEP